MAIIDQKDKRSGITYVYKSVSYRDEKSGDPKSKRKLIGKRDEKTGKIIPTDGRGKKRSPYYNKQTGEEKNLLDIKGCWKEIERLRKKYDKLHKAYKNVKDENQKLKDELEQLKGRS